MRKEKDIIKEMKTLGYIEQLYAKGMKPSQVKSHIIEELNVFYSNKQVLNDLLFNSIVSDWINLNIRRATIKNFDQKVGQVLDIYRKALQTDRDAVLDFIYISIEESVNFGNLFWSLYDIYEKLDNEYDRVNYKMGLLSRITEGILKHLMKEFFGMLSIINEKPCEYVKLLNMDFGVVASSLAVYWKEFFELRELKISDWRNIAAHYKYAIVKNKIQCKYGKGDKEKVIYITEEELDKIIKRLHELMHIMSFSQKMFVYDNAVELKDKKGSFKLVNQGRPEIEMLMNLTAIMAGGFEILKLEHDSNLTEIKLRELYLERNKDFRKKELIKMLIHLWKYTKSKRIVLMYEDTEKFIKFSVSGNACKRIFRNEFNLEVFMRKINIEYL